MYATEIALLVVIIILLISIYFYQPEPPLTPAQASASALASALVNCQDCSPSTKARCQTCPVECHECVNCAPNCSLCNTDCQKCKTGSCQPSCDKCLSSTCMPDCTSCSQSCSLDCTRLRECTLPFKQCKIVGEGLSFNLASYATYNKVVKVTLVKMKTITSQSQGHLFTLVNSDSIISLYLIDKRLKLYANVNKKEATLESWGSQDQLQILKPATIYLQQNENSLQMGITGSQFSTPIPDLDITQKYTVYLGGLPPNLKARAYPSNDPYVSFIGCLTNIFINTLKAPQEFMLRGAQVGCPRKYLLALT
jgi:hypothetical protein